MAIITADTAPNTTGDEDRLTVLVNQGDGTFLPHSPTLFAGDGALDLAFGDFDRNGLEDIVVTNFRSGEVTILSQRSPLDFASSTLEVGLNPVDVKVIDLDDDGDLDFGVTNSGSNDVSLLLNDGTGNFPSTINISAGSQPSALAFADLDLDGRLDMVVSNYLSDNVIIVSDVAGSALSQPVTVSARPRDIGIVDVDADGRLESLLSMRKSINSGS